MKSAATGNGGTPLPEPYDPGPFVDESAPEAALAGERSGGVKSVRWRGKRRRLGRARQRTCRREKRPRGWNTERGLSPSRKERGAELIGTVRRDRFAGGALSPPLAAELRFSPWRWQAASGRPRGADTGAEPGMAADAARSTAVDVPLTPRRRSGPRYSSGPHAPWRRGVRPGPWRAPLDVKRDRSADAYRSKQRVPLRPRNCLQCRDG